MSTARRKRHTWFSVGLALSLCGTGCVSPAPVLGPLGIRGAATQAAAQPAVYTDAPWQRLLLARVGAGWTHMPPEVPGVPRPPPLPALVDYDTILAQPDDLDAYLRILAASGPATSPAQFPTDAHQLAYYVNAYNGCAIRAVLAQYPADSVYNLSSPRFESDWHFAVDGRPVNLDDLRQKAWAAAGADVRVLFALCEAAVGSPPLARFPYKPENIFEALDAQAKACLRLPQIARVSHEQQQLQLWWRIIQRRDDFAGYYARLYGTAPASLLNVIVELSGPQDRRALGGAVGYKIVELPFDRTLNRLGVRAQGTGSGTARAAQGACYTQGWEV